MSVTVLTTGSVRRWQARALVAEMERTWVEAHRVTGGPFPHGCCVEASCQVVDELLEKMPDVGAMYVWGDFLLHDLPRPWFSMDGRSAGHAWVELADGTILDITAGQFFGGPALWMLEVGSVFRRHYQERERGAHP